jgi:RNA polymerase sigma-B factor
VTSRDGAARGFDLLPPPRAASGDSRSDTTPRRTARPGPAGRPSPERTAAAGSTPLGSTPLEPTGSEPTPLEPTPLEPTPLEPTGSEPTGSEPIEFESVEFEPTEAESAARALLDERMRRLRALTPGGPAQRTLRQQVVESQLPLVHHLAQRFRGRGEPYDDLVQVGTIGLLNAVDRFDPNRGAFSAFAIPTILGEIRRHFRDRSWAMRVPRRLQDFGRRVSSAREQLTQRLGRSPTVQELAEELHGDPERVVEAIETAAVFATVPLPSASEEVLFDSLGSPDHALERVEQRVTLDPLLARLPVRERRILQLRFGQGLSQSQIAAEVGISQMHVSRLLTRSLGTLREALTEEV